MVLNKNDELVMKLLYYFITEEGYNPIILHGAKDEVWLEKLNGEYKIVRIVSNHIHNNEQYNNDLEKAERIIKDIKKKTFSFKMPALSIFTNVGDAVEVKSVSNINCVNIDDSKKIEKNKAITKVFPEITKKLKFDEKGVALFNKLTKKINIKNMEENKKATATFGPKPVYVTKFLIAINIFVFMLSMAPGYEIFEHFSLIRGGEIYRIITSAFLHANIMHLGFNMWALYILGNQIEKFYGPVKYMSIYLFSAIVGSLLSLILLPPGVVSVGASGAIFGLLGSLVYFGYHHRVYMGAVLKSRILPILGLNLLFTFMMPNINAAAHVGGLVGGALISSAIAIKGKTTKFEQGNAIAITIILIIFLVYMAFFK